jgi:hypothetical protein
MRTDACHRRKSLRALTTHSPRSALAWLPDGAPKRATRRTPGRRSPRLARSTTDTGFLGARFWGQVRGSSGRLKVLQDKGGTSGETSQIAGKARYQAPFPGHIAAGRILHGKEGVDGSSPSEGSSKRKTEIGDFCCLTQHHRAPPHYRREGYSARCAAAKPLQIEVLPGTSEHFLEAEGLPSREPRPAS